MDIAPSRSHYGSSRPPQQLQRSHTANDVLASSRNRRSASMSEQFGKLFPTLSDTFLHRVDGKAGEEEPAHGGNHDAGYYYRAHHQPSVPSRSMSRPGTSLGITRENVGAGPKRVTVEERERQDMELRADQRGTFLRPNFFWIVTHGILSSRKFS
jgi:hypothetical protein